MPLMRLDRYLSGQGAGTRKDIRAMIRRGMAEINGRPARSPDEKVDAGTDAVFLNGDEVRYEEHVYYMMNKPAGFICATDSPREPTVLSLLPGELQRPGLFPAGRLDKDTVGLLLITDDGDFAHRMLAPKKHVDKTYFVKTDVPVPDKLAEEFRQGVELEDGLRCLPAALVLFPGAPDEAEVTVREGKYHQIKRMFRRFGLTVVSLKRLSIGGLKLDPSLGPGGCRKLKSEEIAKIFK